MQTSVFIERFESFDEKLKCDRFGAGSARDGGSRMGVTDDVRTQLASGLHGPKHLAAWPTAPGLGARAPLLTCGWRRHGRHDCSGHCRIWLGNHGLTIRLSSCNCLSMYNPLPHLLHFTVYKCMFFVIIDIAIITNKNTTTIENAFIIYK